MLLPSLPLGRGNLTTEVAFVLEFGFDAGDVEPATMLRKFQREAFRDQRLESRLRLLQRARG